jgi:hypothetical protein
MTPEQVMAALGSANGGGGKPADTKAAFSGSAPPGITGVANIMGKPQGVPGQTTELPPQQPAVQPPAEARPEMLKQGVGDVRQIEQQRQGQADQMQQQAKASAPHMPTKDEMRLPPQQAQLFFPLMMLLSAIGGAKTATPMTAALQNMNGVLQAQVTGSKDMAEHHEKLMMENYKAALEAHKEMLADMKPKIAALANGSPESLQEMRFNLMEKGYRASEIDQLMNGDSYKNLITLYKDGSNAQTANEKMLMAKITADANRESREKIASKRDEALKHSAELRAQGVQLSDAESAALETAEISGKLDPYKVNSRNVKMLAKQFMDNPDIDMNKLSYDVAVNKAKLGAEKAALTNIETRTQNTDIILNTVTGLQKEATGLIGKLNHHSEWVNQKVNDLISKFGNDKELQRLAAIMQGISREYGRAMMGATSQAQMHVEHKKNAEEIANMNMPLNKLIGAFEGINIDIEYLQKNSKEGEQNIKDKMDSGYVTPGGASAPAGGDGKTPAVGAIEDGHKFKGGNPADPANWVKQ